MQSLRRLTSSLIIRNVAKIKDSSLRKLDPCMVNDVTQRQELHNANPLFNNKTAIALRNRKPKAQGNTDQYFVDIKQITVTAGNGGDGAISFLHLFANEFAGPDGGDGGNGGHVIFEASTDVKDLNHIKSVLYADNGESGMSKDCFGKNAEHLKVKVPVGTIVRSQDGTVVADLNDPGTMFIAARGGAGGHGNSFFKSDTEQSPKISEYGAIGETWRYIIEIKSMANVGLIGLPNAGKSTLLRAISRARPKVAPYPFTTLKPYIGMVQYDDYEQIAVADLPGLIAESHKNRGLGIMFLKHAERCAALLFVLDISTEEPWADLALLQYELEQFNPELTKKPCIIIANKIDLPKSEENLKQLQEKTQLPIVPISAKMGRNVSTLLAKIRIMYNNQVGKDSYGRKLDEQDDDDTT